MISFILEKPWARQALFGCLCLSFLLPTAPYPFLYAEEYPEEGVISPCPPCYSVNFIESEDRQQRCRLAAAAAGATIAGLTAGIIYVVACTGGRRRHCSSSSSSSCYSSYSSCYSDSSSCGCSGSSYSRYCSPSYSCYSSHSECGCHKKNCSRCRAVEVLDPADVPIGIAQGVTGLGGRCKVCRSSSLSGSFFPGFSSERAKGSFTVFMQSPDGRIRSLGRVSLLHPSCSSMIFGPYTQPGVYTFGIRVEEEIEASTQIQAGRFEIQLNGSSIESYDFHLPSGATIGYEPPLATFELK